jgi:hypothetical protein
MTIPRPGRNESHRGHIEARWSSLVIYEFARLQQQYIALRMGSFGRGR